VVSVVALVKSCSADRWAQSDKYASEAEAHRPLLITDTSFAVSRIKIVEVRPVTDSSGPAVGVTPRIEGRVVAANIGNAPARLAAASIWDTSAGTPVLRQRLLDRSQPLRVGASNEFDYGRGFVLPGETTSTAVDYTLSNVQGGNTVVHLLLLYENESGKLFDTYTWARVESVQVRFILTAVGEPGIEASVVDRAGQSHDSYIYSAPEAKLVRSRLGIQ
jgi:hypothetical protein